MKKLMIVMFSVGLALGASAQRVHVGGHVGGGIHYVAPRVVIGGGFYSPYYSPFYSPFLYPYGYPFPYGYGYARNGYRPTRLDMQVQDIKNDYQARINSAKLDLKGKAKRQKVRELKSERDQAINQAKINYYKTPRNYNYRNNNNNNNNGSND